MLIRPGGGFLTATKGLPASGKTSWARQQPGAACFSRDSVRASFNGAWSYGDAAKEDLVTELQFGQISTALKWGLWVIADDTNLNPAHMKLLENLAQQCGSQFQVKDFTHVPVETCIFRDMMREVPVGEEVIRSMAARWL